MLVIRTEVYRTLHLIAVEETVFVVTENHGAP